MVHIRDAVVCFVIVGLFGIIVPVCAQATEQPKSATRQAQAAAARQAEADAQTERLRAEAQEAYDDLVDAYMHNRWEELEQLAATIRRYQRFHDRQQRLDVRYIQSTDSSFRPKWWDKCSHPSNVSFKAELWDRPLMANYMPGQDLGAQAVSIQSYVRNRRYYYDLKVIVTWKPSMVNSDTPATGKLAEIHDVKLGDIGEVIVWHELGHCYITNYLPNDHVVELYREHKILFSHLQEFYADLTAIYHASPGARRVALMLRLDGLDRYNESQQHARASHAIGSLILLEVLDNPDDWPSFHFPPAVPDQQVELNSIIYLYEHMDPDWSLNEARALRELVGDFIKKSGEKTLRARGVVPLPNKLKFSILAGQDRKHQAARDAYVAKKLKALIAAGRADTLVEGETYEPPVRNVRQLEADEAGELLRVDIPM